MLLLRYTKHEHIDMAKWDNCIAGATNGNIYAYSFYLDAMADNWHALIWDDYKAVMPLTWKKKYGIAYLYQPFFCASLGVFGKDIDENIVKAFLQQIPAEYKYWDIYLNHGNYFGETGFPLYERTNYILYLDKPYEKLYESYRDNIKRNIKKSVQHGFVTRKNTAITEVIHYAKEQSIRFSPIDDKTYNRFEKLYHLLQEKDMACTYAIYSPNNELMASCAFVFSHNRAYYILVGNNPLGKTMGASHALIDAFIKDHANSNLILDFEGSDISGLSFFYSSYGAVIEKYPGLIVNKLPKLVRWLKRT